MERVMDIGEVRRCRGSGKLGLRARRGEVGLPTRASNSVHQHWLVFRTLGLKNSDGSATVSCQFRVAS